MTLFKKLIAGLFLISAGAGTVHAQQAEMLLAAPQQSYSQNAALQAIEPAAGTQENVEEIIVAVKPAPVPPVHKMPPVPMPKAAPVYDAPIRLLDVMKWAYQNNPTLRAGRAEMKAVQEEMPQAMAGWKPNIDASGNISSVKIDGNNFGGEGTTSKEVELGFNQPLYRGGRTVAAVDGAEATIAAQRALLKAMEQKILLDVVTAYMDVVRDQALLDLATSNEKVLTKELEATKTRFDVGELTKTDVSQGEARVAAARANRVSAMGAMQSSLAVYQQVVGQPVTGLLGYPDIKLPIPDDLAAAEIQAESNNPEIIAAQYIEDSAQENISETWGELMPELALFGSWNRQFDPQPGLLKESTTRTVGISATIPLYTAGGTRSRVRQAKHTANQRWLEVLEMKRAVRQQVVSHWETLRAAKAEIESRKAQVEASQVALDGVREEAAFGSRTVLDVLDADQELLDAKVALVSTQRNEVVAEYALAGTLGVLTPETLGFSDFTQEFEAHLEEIKWKILGTDVDFDGDTP
ncbi:MAG: TolC family outer membrane protein [Rhodospirillales bacterium]|nr:TolC family outer membrane protein [Rhodospirillales bacterium]MCB9995751.1 TolC family outer membrane protein [Rhodospirillales bacterium]